MPRRGAIQFAEPRGGQVFILTTPCVVCGAQYEFLVDRIRYEDWQYNTKIQDAFPDMSDEEREILISGTCDGCFNNLFKVQ